MRLPSFVVEEDQVNEVVDDGGGQLSLPESEQLLNQESWANATWLKCAFLLSASRPPLPYSTTPSRS